MTEYFHDWLRREIKEKKKYFSRFAREIGINQQHFGKIINCYQYPSPYWLSIMFKHLNIPEEEQKEVVWKIWCEKVSSGSKNKF